ncbi:MAG: hypothetical protein ACK4VO_00990 [Pseudobdellovibrio sp.]
MRYLLQFVMLTFSFLTYSCGTQLKSAPINKQTGLITDQKGNSKLAAVIKSEKIEIQKYKNMIFVANGGEFAVQQTKELNFFDLVLNTEQLEKRILENNLQSKIYSLKTGQDLHDLSKYEKPFLVLYFKKNDFVKSSHLHEPYLQMVVSDPLTFQDVFVAQVPLNIWTGNVNDQNTRYPLFNAFYAWIYSNK